ncbi:hypothetical protein Q5752_002694 [Cryptotrichosporon argae]
MSLDPTSSAIHLNLPPTSSAQGRAPSAVTVHPSVLASIVTHDARRPADAASAAPRVIGALLGARSESGHEVDVRASFAVPHTEGEDMVALDMPFLQQLAELLGKTGIKESIVGWYATSPVLDGWSALIQNYFSGETAPFPAVHLTVDTALAADAEAGSVSGLGTKAYVSAPLGLGNKAENCVFLPVPVVVKFAPSERAALDLVTSPAAAPSPALPPLPTLSHALAELAALLDRTDGYVQSVISGATPGDALVGRHLLEGVGRWSATATGDADGKDGIKDGLQDTLTVAYLANLVRTQVELAGRLALLPQQQAQAQPQAQAQQA